MKKRIISSLAIAATVAIPAKSYAAPIPVQSSTIDSGRIQERYSGDKPELQITDKVLVQDDQTQTDLKEAGKISFKLNSVTIEGNTVFTKDELAPLYKANIGKTVTLSDMYEVRDQITKLYREQGYILSRAVVPAQRLGKEGADFKIRIVEGYLNSVSTQGTFHGNQDILNSYLAKLRKTGPLNSNDLERYLLLINDLAGTTATAVLKPTPGTGNVGATDLVVELNHKYVNGLVSIDNSGTKYIGRDLLSAEASVNSALGLSEKITARGIMSFQQPNELKFGDFSYQMPIDSEGTKIKILGGKTDTHPGADLSDLNLDGKTEIFEMTLTHPFLRSRKENLTARAEFDYKDTETDAGDVVDYDDKTREVSLGLTYDLADTLGGVNLFDISGSQGLDVMGATNSNDLKSRANGDATYTKFNFEASRLQHIVDNVGILFAAAGQYSFQPLLADEEFGVGGTDFGRGYDFSEITGEQGLAGKIELQYGVDVGTKWLNSYQLYTFYDAGEVWQRDQLPGEAGKSSLTSAGVGSRFNFFNSASGFVEVAKPLTREVASEGDRDLRFDFGLSYVF